MDRYSLGDKVALVTGGGSGIGKAAAIRLAWDGAKVGVLDLNLENAQQTVEEIHAQDAPHSRTHAIALSADVADEEQMRQAVEKLVQEFGRVNIVFANAGINGVWAPLDEITLDEWNRTLTTNLTGTFVTVKAALPYLKDGGGSVIVTASVNGTRIFSNTGATAYSCSKAAQVAFTKMTAVELGPHQIRVNVICPGATETNIDQSTEQRHTDQIKVPVEYPEGNIPLTHGAPARAEQVANAVAFLASDASDYITGTEIWVDAGLSLVQG